VEKYPLLIPIESLYDSEYIDQHKVKKKTEPGISNVMSLIHTFFFFR
jgi:hypothetical protein